ncbi:hypothetical protein SAMN05877838_0209 [Hoeflea halophila]|uniref:Core-binding (CB) domain-containing protein n=1 Tax=Hoeflea halophila TaxID=714899 RepID=A0A286HL94_9HYPH|nr:hypothetical protein SAMN05877838_0209 [Hoeflea halophila]
MPEHLRPYMDGKREFEIQLGGDKREALRKHATAVASIQRQIGIARHKHELATGEQSKPLTHPLTAQQIATRDYQSQIDFDAEIRAHDHRYAAFEVDLEHAQLLREGFAGKLSDDQLEQLVGARVERARLAGHTDAEKGSPEWRRIAQALCVSGYEAMARQDERNEGDFTGKPTHPDLSDTPPIDDDIDPTTFADIINAEVKRRARGNNAKPLPDKTAKKYRDTADEFAKFRKSNLAATVKLIDAKNWMEALQDAGKLSNRTIKAKVQSICTILNWGRQNDPEKFLPAGNPLTGMKMPDFNSTPSHLRAFTLAEAAVILSAARKETKPLFRWLPWLCAYSGMRVNEAGQLCKEDFFQIGDQWFWNVTTAGRRSLKTASSERRIPVHPALINEGFISFVEKSASGRLFKGETKDEINVQPRMSTWVRGIIPCQKRPQLSPNHGWRHLFEDLCRRDNIPEDARNYMTGRATGKSQDLYGRSDVMLPGLADAMRRIEPIPV